MLNLRKPAVQSGLEAVRRSLVGISIAFYLSIYLYLIHNKPYSTAKRKKWNRMDKANSSYSRPKKRKNENESSYNKY